MSFEYAHFVETSCAELSAGLTKSREEFTGEKTYFAKANLQGT